MVTSRSTGRDSPGVRVRGPEPRRGPRRRGPVELCPKRHATRPRSARPRPARPWSARPPGQRVHGVIARARAGSLLGDRARPLTTRASLRGAEPFPLGSAPAYIGPS